MTPAIADEPAASGTPLWRDPTQPVELRVRDLVGRMTLEEKALQVCNVAPSIPRLGLPAYNYWNECLHGVGATALPLFFHRPLAWRRVLTRSCCTR